MKPLMSLVCVAALALGCADARNETTTVDDNAVGTSGETAADRGSREFAREMMEANTAEVQLGQLAGERGSNADVRQFGETMARDHGQAAKELGEIVARHNIAAGEVVIDDEHRALIDRLTMLRGAEFDREFIDAMVDGHQDVVDKLQSRVDGGKSVFGGDRPSGADVRPEPADNPAEASLNQWAAKALPIVRGHLERAKTIDERLEQTRTSRAN
jgi:putative membrane protein